MIILMTLIYVVFIIVTFKVVKIKVSPTSVATAVFIGVLMLGGVVIGWQLSAPMTGQMVVWRRVLQVNPDVREHVSKVYVEPYQKVKIGDPLFEVNPDRFQDTVDQATADLKASQTSVSQLESGVRAAEAAVKKSQADTAAAKAQVDTAQALQKVNAGSIAKLKVIEAQQGFRAAQANEKLNAASLKQAKFSLEAARHSVDVAQAALNTANFNRTNCTYRSPINGQVINWQIREGTPVAPFRFTANGTVMDDARTAVLAVYPQNLLKYVKPGNRVEMTFKRRPGQIVSGKVERIIKYTGEGQFAPTPVLPSAANIGSKGYLVVYIQLDNKDLARQLPLGAAGSVAIYTDFGKPFQIISRVTIRIQGWMNYLPV